MSLIKNGRRNNLHPFAIDALVEIHDLMRRVPNDPYVLEFDMGLGMEVCGLTLDEKGCMIHKGPPRGDEPTFCGFCGNAIGCATQYSWFQVRGLTMGEGGEVRFAEAFGMPAVDRFFCLPPAVTDALFGGDYFEVRRNIEHGYEDLVAKTTPAQVARRIELFMDVGDIHKAVEKHLEEVKAAGFVEDGHPNNKLGRLTLETGDELVNRVNRVFW